MKKAPLSRYGSRVFNNIGELAEVMETTRDNVNSILSMPGSPYAPIPGRKKPIYVEYEVAEFLGKITKYKPKM